jgi:HPt (histidine-containing phosphotransfer) domain-containing protein
MDIQMPEMDGLQATRVIRATSEAIANPDVVIIAMTAHAMQGDAGKCLAAGMNDYVAKPVTPVALASVLQKWLKKLDGRASEAKAGEVESLSEPDVSREECVCEDFDEAVLLYRVMGDLGLARSVGRQALEDLPVQLDGIALCVEAGNAAESERLAHTMKGVAATFGAPAVARLAAELEAKANEGDLEFVRENLEELQRRILRLRSALSHSKLLNDDESQAG